MLWVFLFLTIMDSIFFYLGKRGILEYLRKRKWGLKIYNLAHKRAKKFIHKKTSTAILFAKLTYGGAAIAIIYLGEHIPFRKFFFLDALINLIFCGLIWALVGIFRFSLGGVLNTLQDIQQEILLVIIAIMVFRFVDKMFDRKLSRWFTGKN